MASEGCGRAEGCLGLWNSIKSHEEINFLVMAMKEEYRHLEFNFKMSKYIYEEFRCALNQNFSSHSECEVQNINV